MAELELEAGTADEPQQGALAAVVACSKVGHDTIAQLRREFPKTAGSVDRMLRSTFGDAGA
jgi:hypothetical protein